MARKFTSWDDYVYPGTKVLRNIRNIRDGSELEAFESVVTVARIDEALVSLSTETYDFDFMKSVHHWIFQDVYEWAGESRVGPPFPSLMVKGGPDVSAGPGVDPGDTDTGHTYESDVALESTADRAYRLITDHQNLVGLEFDPFLTDLAEAWSEVNFVHAFREGNTRSQFVFFKLLAADAGYELDMTKFATGAELREEFNKARFFALRHNSSWMKTVLLEAVQPLPRDDGTRALQLPDEPPRPGSQPRLGDRGIPKNRGRFTDRRRGESSTSL